MYLLLLIPPLFVYHENLSWQLSINTKLFSNTAPQMKISLLIDILSLALAGLAALTPVVTNSLHLVGDLRRN